MNMFDLVVISLRAAAHRDWALLFLVCYEGIFEFMMLPILAGSLRVRTGQTLLSWTGKGEGLLAGGWVLIGNSTVASLGIIRSHRSFHSGLYHPFVHLPTCKHLLSIYDSLLRDQVTYESSALHIVGPQGPLI